MPPLLTIDDFRNFSATCEIRYPPAFRIYDRTGEILELLRSDFTDLAVSTASPAQTAFTANEGSLVLELAAARFVARIQENRSAVFAKQCKAFLDTVIDRLGLRVFTRIGFRYILRKEFPDLEAANQALAALRLVNLETTKRFNSSDSPTEVMFRWEDTQTGTLLRLKAEKLDSKISVAPELREDFPKFDKSFHVLSLDIDSYTVAPVERDQWECAAWLELKIRLIRKEVDEILQGARR